jgi:hypothetical protein
MPARAWLLGLALAWLSGCAPQPAQPSPADVATGQLSPAAPAASTPPPAAGTANAPVAQDPGSPTTSTAPTPIPPAAPASLLVTCGTDADCEVKDVGSCCGYRPACVNRDARPDPAAVQARCAQEGRVGICGFREIQGCQCVSGRCKPADGPGSPAATLELH